jgi:hypothetical protein
MIGLVILLVLLAFGAICIVAGVDSREGFTDDRGPASTVGLS